MEVATIIEEPFEFFLPISKAIVDRGTEHSRWIDGLASTAARDLQKEIVEQDGIDYSYCLKHGYFNNDHKPGFGNKVGEPTEMITKMVTHPRTGKKQYGLYVKGFLYNNHTVANEIWELLKAQESTPNAKRRVGFSIQGKVKKRFGMRIIKSWVQDIAITAAPINTETWASIVKSLLLKSAWCIHPNSDVCKSCDSRCDLYKDEFVKSLQAGYSIVGQTGGAALRPQSLDSDMKVLEFFLNRKGIRKGDLVGFLHETNGIPHNSADKLVEIMFSLAHNIQGGINV